MLTQQGIALALYHSLGAYTGVFFDVACAVLAAISAALWYASSRISFTLGFDTDAIFKTELERAGKLNAWAASAAAVAATVVAAKAFLVSA